VDGRPADVIIDVKSISLTICQFRRQFVNPSKGAFLGREKNHVWHRMPKPRQIPVRRSATVWLDSKTTRALEPDRRRQHQPYRTRSTAADVAAAGSVGQRPT